MTDRCVHLEYREAGNGKQFDHERPFCSVVGEFVQPMRADICAVRHNLDPAEDCEYYREEHNLGSVTGFDAEDAETTEEGNESEGGAES